MKHLIKISLAALAALALASCEKTPQIIDFDIVGDFALTAEKGASAGWIPGDKLGVYVTSDGVTQSNLAYTPSEVAADQSMDLDGNKYHMYGAAVGNVALKADAEAAGYKQGKHVIYAYYPYSDAAEDLTAVPVPDITVQDLSYKGMNANQALCFCCGKAEVEGEYSAAPVDLGTLAAKYMELNTGSFSFEDETGLDGVSIVELEISADKAIAQSGTYNLEKGEFNGEGSKSIKFSNCNMEISGGYFGFGTDPVMFFAALSEDEVVATEFTFTAKLSNGRTLSAKATPKSMFGMITFGGSIVLK